jgi:hypothetical protein
MPARRVCRLLEKVRGCTGGRDAEMPSRMSSRILFSNYFWAGYFKAWPGAAKAGRKRKGVQSKGELGVSTFRASAESAAGFPPKLASSFASPYNTLARYLGWPSFGERILSTSVWGR